MEWTPATGPQQVVATEKTVVNTPAMVPASVPAIVEPNKLSADDKRNLLEKLGETQSREKIQTAEHKETVASVKSSVLEKQDTKLNSQSKLSGPPLGKSFAIVAMFLLVVGGLAFLLARASGVNKSSKLNRFLKGITGQADEAIIEIISRQSLGPKKSIVVAKVKDRTLVLGMSDSGISLITEFDDDLEEFKDASSEARASHRPAKSNQRAAAPFIAEPVIQRQVPASAFEDVLKATDAKSAKSQILNRLEGMKRL